MRQNPEGISIGLVIGNAPYPQGLLIYNVVLIHQVRFQDIMEFITDQNVLCSKFKELCQRYNHYRWAVAWAGDPDFDMGEALRKNAFKIEQIVIGLHFYQTSPRFIEQYLDNIHVRYHMLSDGTFHPKVYLFYNSSREWSAIIGSSNFTLHGFHKNTEANVLISDKDGGITFGQISNFISKIWEGAEQVDSQFLKKYKKAYAFQSKKLSSLEKLQTYDKKDVSSILEMMTWDEYVDNLDRSDNANEIRIRLLEKAYEIFRKNKPFDSLPIDTRRALAGFPRKDAKISEDIDWKFFGSMVGAGDFKHDILHNIKIGKALDKIPMKGPVTKEMFLEYCKAFNRNNPIGCATRLLAIKRPDFFVAINNKNKKVLGKMLNMPQSDFNIGNYWNILMRIHNSIWFHDSSHVHPQDMNKKRFQVALLDILSYEE